MGNSIQVAAKHYPMVTDEDFERAAEGGAESGALVVQKSVQQPAAGDGEISQETTQAADSQWLAQEDAGQCENPRSVLSGGHGTRTRNP